MKPFHRRSFPTMVESTFL